MVFKIWENVALVLVWIETTPVKGLVWHTPTKGPDHGSGVLGRDLSNARDHR